MPQPPTLMWSDPLELEAATANGAFKHEPLNNLDSIRLLRVPALNTARGWLSCELFETDIEAFANEEGSGFDRTFCAV